MNHWTSGTFWTSAIFRWLFVMVFLAFAISIFGSDHMTFAEGILVNVAHQCLSLAAGYAYGRRQLDAHVSKSPSRGFAVIMEDREVAPVNSAAADDEKHLNRKEPESQD